METLHVWLLIFAGLIMVVPTVCLLASERELGKQRRELEKLRRNHRTSEAQGSETHGWFYRPGRLAGACVQEGYGKRRARNRGY